MWRYRRLTPKAGFHVVNMASCIAVLSTFIAERSSNTGLTDETNRRQSGVLFRQANCAGSVTEVLVITFNLPPMA